MLACLRALSRLCKRRLPRGIQPTVLPPLRLVLLQAAQTTLERRRIRRTGGGCSATMGLACRLAKAALWLRNARGSSTHTLAVMTDSRNELFNSCNDGAHTDRSSYCIT